MIFYKNVKKIKKYVDRDSVKEIYLHMIQLLPQTEIIKPASFNSEDAIKQVNKYIDNYSCESMSVDISFMNVIDACMVSSVCSAKHFTKYPHGKINWKISSELVRELNKDLNLGNSSYEL